MEALFEHISSDTLYRQLTISEPAFEFFWHYHPEFELTYISKGEGKRFTGDCIEPFRDGDFVLTGPNLPHTWVSEKSAGESALCHAYVVQFKADMFDADVLKFKEFDDIRHLLKLSERGIVFLGETSRKASVRFEKLKRESGINWLLHFWSLLDFLSKESEYRLLSSLSCSPSLNKYTPQRIDRVFKYLDKHYADVVKLRDVADLVHMTETSFSRFFKRNIGMSFIDYLNELRIAAACKLLTSQPDKNMADIAWEAGFKSSTHFNRMFYAKKGCNPGDFRKQFLLKGK